MKRVLVVDDELPIIDLLTQIIRFLGHEALSLTNGSKVYATAKSWKPDLITLDVMMPSPDGASVLDQLKDDPETAKIPVFMVTGLRNDPVTFERLVKANCIISKPIDAKEFIDCVRAALSPV